MKPPLTGSVTTREVLQPVQLIAPEPDQPLPLLLKQLKLYQTEDHRWAVAVVELPFAAYHLLQKKRWLGLTIASIAAEPQQTWTFRSDQPMELTLRLADEVLDGLPAQDSPDSLLEALDRALESEEPEPPRQLASWRYLQVVQLTRTVDGALVKEGFRSRYAP
ncbi:MAG: hypothetical protein JW797_13675 [Bradymonadales bacterium]|nr:hypothetical protein [Bradymonadales bacterium]